MNLIKKSIAAASFALLGATPSHAQLPDISIVTGLLSFDSLPGLNALPLAGGGGLPGLPTGGGLPGLDSLPLSGLAGGGLPGLDSLPLAGLPGLGGGGGSSPLSAIPVIGGGFDFILAGDFLPRLLPDPAELMQLAGGQAVVTELVTGAISNPQTVLSTVNELGINAGVGAVPVIGVLLENPAGLLDYFMAGGTIVTQALNGTGGASVVPGIPLFSQPLGL